MEPCPTCRPCARPSATGTTPQHWTCCKAHRSTASWSRGAPVAAPQPNASSSELAGAYARAARAARDRGAGPGARSGRAGVTARPRDRRRAERAGSRRRVRGTRVARLGPCGRRFEGGASVSRRDFRLPHRLSSRQIRTSSGHLGCHGGGRAGTRTGGRGESRRASPGSIQFLAAAVPSRV